MKVLVVDDVKVERMMLRHLVESHGDLEWVGEAKSASEALDLIEIKQPDALFLDVQMPEVDGFALLRRLDAAPKVVFVSAWPSFAVEAFALDAVDYLLKPVSPDRFAATVARLRKIFLRSEGEVLRHDTADRICLRTTERTVIVPLLQIVALVADGDFTRTLLADGPELLVCRRIGEFDKLLPGPPFVRLDRSLIINLERVKKAERRSRDLAHLWMREMSEPLAVGRTAYERLRGFAS